MERLQWKRSEYQRTDLWTRNRLWDTATHGKSGPRTDCVVRESRKGRTFEKRQRTQLKFNNGIRDRGLKLQLRLGNDRAFNKIVRQTLGLEVAKQVVDLPLGYGK
jgi:hypothetical protein